MTGRDTERTNLEIDFIAYLLAGFRVVNCIQMKMKNKCIAGRVLRVPGF
jgi:hypothetical protein